MSKLLRSYAHPVYTIGVHSLYKACVYQSIDNDNSDETPKALKAQPLWPTALAVVALFGIAATLYISTLGKPTSVSSTIRPDPDIQATYLRALAEMDPALRRARLTDYLSQYPQNARDGAVRAQLAVLDAAADRDWQATLTLAYDPRFDLETRRSAVAAYQDKWGRYLGARDEEIEVLLLDIETIPTLDDRPDRTLPRDPDAYSGIPNDRLVGGGFGREPSVIFRPSREARNDKTVTNGDIVEARVRRNVTPRYPRRAERRGIEAIVTVSMTIGANGRVSVVELIDVQAERYADDFVKEAERAALRTRFHPRTVNGVAVVSEDIRKRYRFKLD